MSTQTATRYPDCGLPCEVGNGLLLRWGRAADLEEIVAFNQRLHRDAADSGDDIACALRDLLEGKHPTTEPRDFTVVVDRHDGDRIVSSMLLLSQTWAYDGLTFACGRPEWVATDVAYRRHGLVRAQFTAIHARSAARGELVQAITGIPWYYRQFGYALCLDRGGSRVLPWWRVQVEDAVPWCHMRAATRQDLPVLAQLYDRHCAESLVSRVRSEAEWIWELEGTNPRSMYYRRFTVAEDDEGQPLGYVQVQTSSNGSPVVHEVAAWPGTSLRALCLTVASTLKTNTPGEGSPHGLAFSLGVDHQAYTALGEQLDPLQQPFAWYMRVPDLRAFIWHIRMVLECRLRHSVMAGYTGILRLNLYLSHIVLVFERGVLGSVATFAPDYLGDGDATFPDLTFLQILFGHRGLSDLRHAYADCQVATAGTAVLLHILFPQRASQPVMLG